MGPLCGGRFGWRCGRTPGGGQSGLPGGDRPSANQSGPLRAAANGGPRPGSPRSAELRPCSGAGGRMQPGAFCYRTETVTLGKQQHPPALSPPRAVMGSGLQPAPSAAVAALWWWLCSAWGPSHGRCLPARIPRGFPAARSSPSAAPARAHSTGLPPFGTRRASCTAVPPQSSLCTAGCSLRAAALAAPSPCCALGISVARRELPWRGTSALAPQPLSPPAELRASKTAVLLSHSTPGYCYTSFPKAHPALLPAELQTPAGRFWSSHSWFLPNAGLLLRSAAHAAPKHGGVNPAQPRPLLTHGPSGLSQSERADGILPAAHRAQPIRTRRHDVCSSLSQ